MSKLSKLTDQKQTSDFGIHRPELQKQLPFIAVILSQQTWSTSVVKEADSLKGATKRVAFKGLLVN